jgi:hypothetical protein
VSKGVCIAIGIVALICAFSFVLLGATVGAALPNGPAPLYALAAFCGLIALACLAKDSRPLSIRLLGATVCAVYVWYVLYCVGKPMKTSEANTLKAIVGLVVFGLPGAYAAITGRYPAWGRHSRVFDKNTGTEKS